MRTTLGIVAIAALLLTGCSTGSPTGPDASGNSPTADAGPLDGEWVLQSGSDETGDFDLKDSTSTLTLTGANTGGRTACNIFGADVEIDVDDDGSGTVDITPTFQTEAACEDPDLMAFEPRYLGALDAVSTVAVSGETLTLSSDSVTLEFSLAAEVPTSTLVGTEWRLESLVEGDAVSSVLGNGLLHLNDDGTFIGNGGCADFSGTWEVSDGKVTVEDFAFVAADCPNEYLDQQEHIETVFSEGFTATVEGDQLTLGSLETDNGLVYRNDASSQA